MYVTRTTRLRFMKVQLSIPFFHLYFSHFGSHFYDFLKCSNLPYYCNIIFYFWWVLKIVWVCKIVVFAKSKSPNYQNPQKVSPSKCLSWRGTVEGFGKSPKFIFYNNFADFRWNYRAFLREGENRLLNLCFIGVQKHFEISGFSNRWNYVIPSRGENWTFLGGGNYCTYFIHLISLFDRIF